MIWQLFAEGWIKPVWKVFIEEDEAILNGFTGLISLDKSKYYIIYQLSGAV
jgi:hypothetical protein